MTTTTLARQTRPKPTGRIPDRSIYERRESEVRSYARAMPPALLHVCRDSRILIESTGGGLRGVFE